MEFRACLHAFLFGIDLGGRVCACPALGVQQSSFQNGYVGSCWLLLFPNAWCCPSLHSSPLAGARWGRIALGPETAGSPPTHFISHLGIVYGTETACVFCLGRFLAEQAPRILDSPSKQTGLLQPWRRTPSPCMP